MTITITPSAAKHFSGILKKYPDAVGIRLGIKPSGCAEYRYMVDVARNVDSEDTIIETQGIKIVINKDALAKIDDTEVDYETQGLNSMLVFHNPHAENACGCGESFSLKT
jgi:iron-sulfur cluster assembly accessory protein